MKINIIKALVTVDGKSTEYVLSNKVDFTLLKSQEKEIIQKISSYINNQKNEEPIPTITNLKLSLSLELEHLDLSDLNDKIYELDLAQRTENQINEILSKIPNKELQCKILNKILISK